jgi:dihydropteroate synthase
MELGEIPQRARLYLRPTGLGCGLRLAGGMARFSSIELSARNGDELCFTGNFAAAEVAQIAARLPQSLRGRFEVLWQRLTRPRAPMALGKATLDFITPGVMGILNVTPDSFSDGGRHGDPALAADAARAMIAAGAVLVDIGGESTRPRAPTVDMATEIARITPVLAEPVMAGLPLSVDTRKAAVMALALDAGVVLVNDVSALTYDPLSLELVARRGCPVVLMHAQGTPQAMQDAPHYSDCLYDVFDWLEVRIAACEAAGIDRSRIIVDPGIGFGKTTAHNLELLRGLSMLHGLGCAVLLGVSRKKLIGVIGGDVEARDRLGGSLALALAGLDQGVQLLRVHDVMATVQAVRLWEALHAENQ